MTSLINLAKPRIEDSEIGIEKIGGTKRSKYRKSKNTWLSQRANSVTNSVYKRAADLLGIDHDKFRESIEVEPMQGDIYYI